LTIIPLTTILPRGVALGSLSRSTTQEITSVYRPLTRDQNILLAKGLSEMAEVEYSYGITA
jgi:hypothetical protein